MNHVYRLVWNLRTQSLVAVSESSKGLGKNGGKAKTLATAVAGALLALGAGQAMATCSNSEVTGSFTTATPCAVQGNNLGVLSIHDFTHTTGLSVGSTVSISGRTLGGASLSGSLVHAITAGSSTFVAASQSTFTGSVISTANATASSGMSDTFVLLTSSKLGGSLEQNGGVLEMNGFGIGFQLLGASSVAGHVANSGSIHGAFAKISEGSTVASGITNAGMVTGSSSVFPFLAVYASTVTGGITNSGTISNGSGTAIGILSASSVSDGIINTGSINGGNRGISISASTLAGGITNNSGGRISGGSTGVSINSATIEGGIRNNGTIVSAGNGSSAAIALWTGTTVNGGITNTGLIDGGTRNAAGILLGGGAILNGGIINSGTITSVSIGIHIQSSATLTGGITNTGLIQAVGNSASAAIKIEASSVAGSIVNSGTIRLQTTQSSQAALYLSHATVAGGITNSGTISATGHEGTYGIYLDRSALTSVSGNIVNAATGTISGEGTTGGYGIYLSNSTMSGSIINQGLIVGKTTGGFRGYGINISNSSMSGGITNSGTISGGTDGIKIDHSTVSGGITNSGTILGNNAAGINIGAASVVDSVINAGVLTGGQQGLFVNGGTVTGSVWNRTGGTISGTIGDGIFLAAGATVGNILNDGRITADSSFVGLAVRTGSTVTGSIVNSASGVISGGGNGIAVKSNNSSVGSITNAGSISAGHTGIALYLGAPTVTGDIVNSGTISAAGTGIGVFDSAVVGGTLANTGVISGDYGINVESGATVGSITNAGRIIGTTKSLDLNNTTSAFTIANTGTLSGAANIGINTLNLNGTTSRVIGNTTGTGTVNVNGTFSSEGSFSVGFFNVNGGALFNMAHGITATTVSNSGILNVGQTSQTITGNYTQAASGVYRIGLTDATSNYGKLNVTGTATVAGGVNVVINGNPTIVNGTTIAGVITSTGAMTVTPANITVTDNSRFYNFTAAAVSNPGHALDLIATVDSNVLPNAVGPNNPAAASVAQNLQNIFNAGVPASMQPVFDRLGAMTPAQVSNALSQTVPTLVGAGSQAGINALHSMNKLIQSRVESNQGLSSGEDTPDKFMWLRGFGSTADQTDINSVSGFHSSTDGLGIGGDAPVNDRVRAGGAITYAKSNIKGNSAIAPSVMDVDTYELVGYASYNLDPQTDINYQVDIGQNKVKSTRQIGFMETTAKASFDSLALHGSVGIGRTFSLATGTSINPSVRLDYTEMRTDGYTETGAGPLNLRVDASTYKEFLLTGDAKLTHQVTNQFKLVGNVSLGYDFLNTQSSSTSAFVGGGSVFESKGLEVSPWVYRLGLGAIYDNKKGVEYSARYDMEGRTSGYLNQTFSAKARWAF